MISTTLGFIAFVSLLVIVGLGSTYFLGPDNPIEEASEKMIEEIIEQEIHVPIGKIDLTPNTPPTQPQG